MAKVHASIAGAFTMLSQATPPSPTLSNPDMILPNSHLRPSSNTSKSSPTLHRPDPSISPSSTFSPSPRSPPLASSNWQPEVGIATAIRMPFRMKPGPPMSVLSHNTYDGGSPLGDIREDEVLTPTTRAKRKSRSLSPSEQEFFSPDPRSRHKGSISDQSTSSNDSDLGDWENFDSSKMMNGRLAADLARADDEMDVDGLSSKRNSVVSASTEDEMAMLNEKAEKILENARKRLTHMEDNLSKARHTMLVSQRSSPNLTETHHPGGLYRSISLAGTTNIRKSRPLYPVVKTNSGIHARGSSDTTGGSGLRKLSMSADSRSSSAQDYGRRADSPQHSRSSPVTRYFAHSPTSSRSLNSPLRILEEEEGSTSTNKTSPDYNAPRGLGINTLGGSKEDLSSYPGPSPMSQVRSASAASVRSTRDLKEQMSELRTRISDLRNRTEADEARRRELQSRDTPSPFTNAKIKERPSVSSPAEKEGGNTPSTVTERARPVSPPNMKSVNGNANQIPTTPKQHDVSPNLEPPTTGQSKGESMIRTDVNTPSLGKRTKEITPNLNGESKPVPTATRYEDGSNVFKDDDDDGEVVASEEEQIYLNEVLEESLHDIEPEVPEISEHIMAAESGEGGRHEDRIDAFDYENMFLHSAMGNYRADDDDEQSDGISDNSEVTDGSSVATKRANQHTPSVDDDDDTEMMEDEEQPEDAENGKQDVQSPNSEGLSPAIQVEPVDSAEPSETNSPTTPKAYLAPRKPWVHSRSDSMDSISTAATFATANSGSREDEKSSKEAPTEILNWGNGTAFPQPPSGSPKKDMTNQWPTPPMSAHTPQLGQSPQVGSSEPELFSPPTVSTGYIFGGHGSSGMPTPPIQSPVVSEISPRTRSPNTYTIQFQPQHSPSPSGSYTRPQNHNQIYARQPPPQPQFISTDSPIPSPAKYTQDRPANTEILMESLIKLADPDFQVDYHGKPGNVFADIDKELVLGLLRSVGGVCDGILKGLAKDDTKSVKILRSRLDAARRVLDGENDTSSGAN